ncbi:hypothetical protein CLUG_03459 [Clavispora lusitaniae ATCC 42720]|uniref:CID domain-containing protein n=1 Tax=Clavispora lusitaniae (strain ATCC 42720) TaxID=306902 RepID=C4Y5M5_CLAL4|nr:uncharacterized protein CLUG_03459 [Clavispora lusitaniae ATCC 42720]EEQ39331.1 hypothetical protein CLUG_03459 [Clavispora lusitaniae ATCC 42720]
MPCLPCKSAHIRSLFHFPTMSFSPDIFNKKLDSLQETQESIVSISQWVLFHHRHAQELCRLWSDYTLTRTSKSNKRLSLLYLCNDVVQEARHKRKPEFSAEFAKILPKALHTIYPSLDSAIKPKVERLVGVWEQRNIFSQKDIKAMREALESAKGGKSQIQNTDTDKAPSTSGPQVATDLVHLNNLYHHMAQLQETCQANLTQVGIQSKAYLPNDLSVSDNLPSPKVYISKLNVLEKLCNMTTKNLEDIKNTRKEIVSVLGNLQKLAAEGENTDDSKVSIIGRKLDKLYTTRQELKEILGEEEPTTQSNEENETPSPSFEPTSDSATDLVPTYENSSDDDDDDNDNDTSMPVGTVPSASRKRKLSDSSVSSTTSKKSVAFSEDIQVKEYDREEQTEVIKIVKSDTESEDDYVPDIEEPEPSDLKEYESKHKDDLELMHEKKTNDEQGEDQKAGLLSLLSKLS